MDCSSSAWVGLVAFVVDVGSCNFLRCAAYLLGFSSPLGSIPTLPHRTGRPAGRPSWPGC